MSNTTENKKAIDLAIAACNQVLGFAPTESSIIILDYTYEYKSNVLQQVLFSIKENDKTYEVYYKIFRIIDGSSSVGFKL